MVRCKQIVGLSHTNMLKIACTFVLVSILCSTSAAQKPSSISDKNSRRRPDPVAPTVTKAPPSKPRKPEKTTTTTKKTVKPTTSGPSITSEDCDKVRKQFINLGFLIDNAMKSPIPGSSQSVCGSSYTCCSRTMEQRLSQNIAKQVQSNWSVFRSRVRKSYAKLKEQETKLKLYMHKLLNTSHAQLHKMFIQTYGFHYNQNSGVFVAFYNRMHQYLRGREPNVGTIVNDFFREMCGRMIKMLHMKNMMAPNSMQYLPNVKCLSQNFCMMDPYKGVPKGIKKDLLRSLTAGRTLAMALGVQGEVLAQIISSRPLAPECKNALTRVQHCAMCRAELSAKPCPNFCLNVVRGCYAPVFMLSRGWTDLSKLVLKLVNLLEGRNSLEHIFENSLSVKISEAITNFQNNFKTYKQTLYNKCKTPYSRMRLPRTMGINSRRRRRRSLGRYTPRRQQNLKRLLSTLRNQVLRPQQNLLPVAIDEVCRKAPFQVADARRCWNGTAVGPYEGALVPATFRGQLSNPEVAVDVSRAPKWMAQQNTLLAEARARVASAVKEKEVPVLRWRPSVVNSVIEASGSGPLPVETGSGAAPVRPRTVERPPEDDEVAPAKAQPPLFPGREGSGAGLLEGSGAARKAPVPRVVKVATTAPPPKRRLPPSSTASTSSSTSTTTSSTTTTTTPAPRKPEVRPPVDDIEGSGDAAKPERRLPERKTGRKTGLPTRPVDEEDSGSGDLTVKNSGQRWPTQQRQPQSGVEGSGAGSGIGPSQDLEPSTPERGPGFGAIPRREQYADPEASYPRTLWIPKSVKVVKDPDAGYDVREEEGRGTGRGPSAQGNTGDKNCVAPKCTGVSSTPLNNLLLLLTVALLSAALLV